MPQFSTNAQSPPRREQSRKQQQASRRSGAASVSRSSGGFSSSAKIAIATCVVTLLFCLYLLLIPDNLHTESKQLNTYLNSKGYTGIGTNVAFLFERPSFLHDIQRDGYTATVKRSFQAGQTLFSAPRHELIYPPQLEKTAAASLLRANERTLMTMLGKEESKQIVAVLFTFYLVYERRLGPQSSLYYWLSSLPSDFAATNSAPYQPAAIARCVDPPAAVNFLIGHKVPRVTLAIANTSCYDPTVAITLDDPVCVAARSSSSSFTLSEMQWAYSVYSRYNIQEGLLLPALSFVRRTGDLQYRNMRIEMSSDREYYSVVSTLDLRAGTDLLWLYPHSPGTALATFGSFDEAFRGVESSIAYESVVPDSFAERFCRQLTPNDAPKDLVWLRSGRPSSDLVVCAAALVATKAAERRAVHRVTKGPAMPLRLYTYGNLTLVVQRQLHALQNATMCDRSLLNDDTTSNLDAYHRTVYDVLAKSAEYLVAESQRLATELGVPPLVMRRGPSPSSSDEEEQEYEPPVFAVSESEAATDTDTGLQQQRKEVEEQHDATPPSEGDM